MKHELQFKVGDLWLCVECLAGCGYLAILSIRETKLVGGKKEQRMKQAKPGARLFLDHKKREDLIALAFDLLAIAERMQPEATYNNSQSRYARGKDQQPYSEAFRLTLDQIQDKKKAVANRWRNLHNRMHILQLAQRVLEDCDEETAGLLATLLMAADQTGTLPIRASIQQSSQHDSLQ